MHPIFSSAKFRSPILLNWGLVSFSCIFSWPFAPRIFSMLYGLACVRLCILAYWLFLAQFNRIRQFCTGSQCNIDGCLFPANCHNFLWTIIFVNISWSTWYQPFIWGENEKDQKVIYFDIQSCAGDILGLYILFYSTSLNYIVVQCEFNLATY